VPPARVSDQEAELTDKMFLFLRHEEVQRLPAILALCCAMSVSAHGQTATSKQPAQGRDCAALISLRIEGGIIASAVELPAGIAVTLPPQGPQPPVSLTSLPTHCVVKGEVNHHIGADGKSYGDKFELRMPETWRGRLLFQGGGGLDGNLFPALALEGRPQADSKSPLSRGYAVVSTDAGHQAADPVADGSFGSDPEARTDYYYRSTKIVTNAATGILENFYGRSPNYSYFKGCSTGGREGMIAAQRYPEYFNGVIAGAPAFNVANAAIAEAWDTVQFAAIAPKNAQGRPDLNGALSESDLSCSGTSY
jgi:Tannase and feruloyl esterase